MSLRHRPTSEVTSTTAYRSLERRRDALVVLLTVVTGSIDAIGFTRLGGVFTSVMTGNMVLLGVSAGKSDVSLAIHTSVAFFAFIFGSLLGARFAGHAAEDEELFPRAILGALLVELGFFVIFTACWEYYSGHPTGVVEYTLLGINAVALGVQSAAVLRFGVNGMSTTYLTGTLTQLVASLTKRDEPISGRSVAVLSALIGGAALGALAAVNAPMWAPVIPLSALVVVVAAGEVIFHRRRPLTETT